MTVLRSYGWYLILAGIALALPPWFGMGRWAALGLTLFAAATVMGGAYLLSVERKGETHR